MKKMCQLARDVTTVRSDHPIQENVFYCHKVTQTTAETCIDAGCSWLWMWSRPLLVALLYFDRAGGKWANITAKPGASSMVPRTRIRVRPPRQTRCRCWFGQTPIGSSRLALAVEEVRTPHTRESEKRSKLRQTAVLRKMISVG